MKERIIPFRFTTMERIIYIATIVIMFIIMTISINTCQSYKHEYNINISALSDSIHHYKTKSGQLVAQTKMYETDIKHLQYLNDSLYTTIKSLKNKNITQATQFSGTIVNELHDTTWILVPDTTQMTQTYFDFSNQYRQLSGNINVHRDKINLKFEKDIVNFNYTVALDKNNNIHITSTNPYVQYNQISGFTIPKSRKKRFGIGPNFSHGYDPVNNNPAFFIGVGIQYNLIQF